MKTTKGKLNAMPRNFLQKEMLLLKISGMSLDGNEKPAYRIYSLAVLLIMYSYPFTQLAGAVIYSDDVDFDTVYCILGTILVLAKMTAVLRKRLQIRETLMKLGRKPFLLDLKRGGEKEAKLFKECNLITTIQASVYVVSLVCLLSGSAVFTIATRIRTSDYNEWKLPFGKMLVFDLTASPSFEIAFFYQIISISLLSVSQAGTDLIIFFVLCYISYQFKCLQNNLKQAIKNSCDSIKEDAPVNCDLSLNKEGNNHVDKSQIPWKYLHESLKQVVLYHLEIISVTKEMENVFSILFLVILLYTTIMLCFMMYRLSLLPITDPEAITYIVEIIFCCIELAILCFWGEFATNGSEGVANAAYEADFVGTDRRLQQGLILIIKRSQSPVKITAGKFTDLRLSTFVWIMRTTYSCFMLLQNINGNV